ncbi:MAG: hypothetical protein KUG82_01480 [Pseudomonadales bacterium]|nr:hypothetical protein [Pseudomonadales bacterium]
MYTVLKIPSLLLVILLLISCGGTGTEDKPETGDTSTNTQDPDTSGNTETDTDIDNDNGSTPTPDDSGNTGGGANNPNEEEEEEEEEENETDTLNISLLSPKGILTARANTLLSLTTTSASACQYDQNPNVNYGEMSLNLDSQDSIQHTHTINNLEAGNHYIFYVKCQTLDGLLTSTDYSVEFSIQSTVNSGDTITQLTIKELTGVSENGVFARSGIPMPQGLLSESSHISLISENNDAVYPTQTKPLAFWPDGSVRWLLINTQVDLVQYQSTVLNLNVSSTSDALNNPVITTESDDFITVDTGVMNIEIPKTTGGLIHRAFINDELVIDEPSNGIKRGAWVKRDDVTYWGSNLSSDSVALANDPIAAYQAASHASGQGRHNLYDPWTLDVAIEEQGPLVVIVKVSGTHLDNDGMGYCSYVTRMTFTRGTSDINFQHSFIFTGASTDKIQGYGIKLPFTGEIATIESDATDSGTLLQTDFDNYSVNGDNRVGQAAGRVSKGNDDFHMSVILRDMAENFPKALSVENNGIDVELYPKDDSFILNLERYDNIVHAGNPDQEIGYIGDNRSSQGIAKTDRFFVRLGTGPIDTQSQYDQSTRVDAGPPMMFAEAKWYSDSLVMGVGPFHFDANLETGSEVHFRIDRKLKVIEDFMRFNQRKQFGWYGMLEYGDIRGLFCGNGRSTGQVCDDGVFTWIEKGRYGWSANSGEPLNQLWVQFLRTINQDVFTDAEAFSIHQMDIPMIHYGDKNMGSHLNDILYNTPGHVGSVHRHGKQGWSGYAGAIDYSHVGGIETYYYLTGDYRARGVLYEAARFAAKCSSCGYESLRNGLDILSRTTSIFENYQDENIHVWFDQKIETMLSYLYDNGSNSGFISQYNNASPFEYFAQGGSFGLHYHLERTADSRILPMIYYVADLMTEGSNGDAWGLANGAGSAGEFFQIFGIAYALHQTGLSIGNAAEQEQYDRYYSLTKRILEQNCHSVAVGGATSEIPLAAFENIPDNWENWLWEWPGAPNAMPNPAPSQSQAYLLPFARQLTFLNNYMQDYHSYRAFLQLSVAAAVIPPDDSSLTPQ